VQHLEQLLEPKSIAIVGLSDDASKHGGRVLSSLRKVGYQGEVFGVNPRTPVVAGMEMFATLQELPSAPDLVASAVPSGAVPGIVADAGTIGAGAVVVFAGGFAETGPTGRNAQVELATVAAEGGVRVLGPNSGGVIRPSNGLAVSFLTCLDRPADQIRPGPVGLVTQSGGTGSYIHNLAAERGGGLGVSISTGNECDIDIADGIVALSQLDDIRVIALVIETVRNGWSFIEAIRAASEAGKPVVVCRLGGSDHGRAMTATHTGAMARPARVLDGVLASLGVTMTETPGELLDVAEVMARSRIPSGRRVGIVTHSGGVAILLSDLAERHGLELPQPSQVTKAGLGDLLEHGVAANPLDMGGIIGGASRFAHVVENFAASDDFDVVLAVSTAHPRAHTVERVEALEALGPQAIHLWMAGDVGAIGLEMLRAEGLPVTTEPRAAIRAVAGLISFGTDRGAVDTSGESLDSEPGRAFDEGASKQVVTSWGIAVPPGDVANSASHAEIIAAGLDGPLVVKVCSADIAHKTEAGGVETGVGAADVAETFTKVTDRARQHHPMAHIVGALVERQVRGFEVIIGGLTDPVFGPMMLVGFGGIAAEAFEPVMGLVPRTPAQAMALVDRVPGLATALQRIDAQAAGALGDTLLRLGVGFTGSGALEVEINPLAWSGSEWVALDALFIPAANQPGRRRIDADAKGET
jgi:acyl-CoA synthetase (NDP forming)